MPHVLAPMIYFAVLASVFVWAVFWVIRLAVRYGMNDALSMNREWLAPQRNRDVSSDECLAHPVAWHHRSP